MTGNLAVSRRPGFGSWDHWPPARSRDLFHSSAGLFTSNSTIWKLDRGCSARAHGKLLPRHLNKTIVLVGGGTGTASLLEIALHYKPDNDWPSFRCTLPHRSFWLDEFGPLDPYTSLPTTEVLALKGTYTRRLQTGSLALQAIRPRILSSLTAGRTNGKACFQGPTQIVAGDQSSDRQYMTSCGVGICGKCASPSGALTCMMPIHEPGGVPASERHRAALRTSGRCLDGETSR